MPITATGPTGKALEIVRDMLAASPDFQTMMGAANAAAAAAKCVLQFSIGDAPPPVCFLVATEARDEEAANRTIAMPMQVNAIIAWPDSAPTDPQADRAMRALNLFDGLRASLSQSIGTGANLAKAEREYVLPIRVSEDDPDRADTWRAEIIFSWSY